MSIPCLMCEIYDKQYKKAAYLEQYKQNHEFLPAQFLNKDPVPIDLEIEKTENFDISGSSIA